MASACFRFLHYSVPNFRLFISGGIDPETARVLFRAACYSRRALLRFEPERFIPYLVRELTRTGCPITMDQNERPSELTFSVDIDEKNQPFLRIVSQFSKPPLMYLMYSGGFYAWLGNSEKVAYKRGRKSLAEAEARRLKMRVAEAAAPSNNHDRTSHLSPYQRKLYEEHKLEITRRGRISLSRRGSNNKARRIIKDHYTTPPDQED